LISWNAPDFWVQTGNGTTLSINSDFAWMHGGIQQDIGQTWLGLVGPGVVKSGIDSKTWTDHTDVRPTMLALLGLQDDYLHDGRVIVEQLNIRALPEQIQANLGSYGRLATAYKRLNAPFGDLSMASIRYTTKHVRSIQSDAYDNYLTMMVQFTARLDTLAAEIRSVLEGAAFGSRPLDQESVDILVL
jgi:hypothetical protein